MKTITNKNKLSEMELALLLTAIGIKAKAGALFTSFWGWIASVATLLATFLLPLGWMFLLLFAILGFDLIFGILAAKKRGEALTSSKARQTFFKILIYSVTLSLAYGIECLFAAGFVIKVLFAIASLIELYSVISNILIINPDMPFFRIFTGIVSGEIAKKTGISKEKVEEFLKPKE